MEEQEGDPSQGLDFSTLPIPEGPELPKVGNYQILHLIKDKIYLGQDTTTSRTVNIKLLNKEQHENRLQIISRLRDNLYTYEDKEMYELLIHPDTEYFITSNYSDINYYWIKPIIPSETTLVEYFNWREEFPESDIKDYFNQICKIVRFLHTRGILLARIALGNFSFVDLFRKTLILNNIDFCKVCPEDHNSVGGYNDKIIRSSLSRLLMSTTPESLDPNIKSYSGKAADIWGLGILLYMLLTRRYPFDDVTTSSIISKIRTEDISFTSLDLIHRSLDVRLLIRLILRKDPNERPNIEEILNHPFLKPRDYKSDFTEKPFDPNEAIFWRRYSR